MQRSRVVFFLDFANINRAARDQGLELDYGVLLSYVAEGRFLVEAHAYVPIDPRNEHRLDGLIQRLWQDGYIVHTKVGAVSGPTYKCDLDVEMTIDVLSTTYQIRPDIIVLGTGDGDLVPLVLEVRRLGIRVEAASFEASASRDLRLRSSGFISLDVYVAEALQVSRTESLPETEDATTDETSGLDVASLPRVDPLSGDEDSEELSEEPKWSSLPNAARY